MPLTKKEQKAFEDMFSDIDDTGDVSFLSKLADLVFEMTGNVNFRMRLFSIAQKLVGKE